MLGWKLLTGVKPQTPDPIAVSYSGVEQAPPDAAQPAADSGEKPDGLEKGNDTPIRAQDTAVQQSSRSEAASAGGPASGAPQADPAKPQSAQQAVLKWETGKLYTVGAGVATLWTEPGGKRDMDAPSFASDGLESWLAGMSIKEKLWLVGKLETQVLYGQQVKLLEVNGEWVKVAALGQTTKKSKDGYPGWLRKSQLAPDWTQTARDQSLQQVTVAARQTTLRDAPDGVPFRSVSFNTSLPYAAEQDGWLQVMTPGDGLKWLPKADAVVHETGTAAYGQQATGAALVRTAGRFVGLPYLWSGMSGFGFDCSGFTYSVHRFHGIAIPRDAAEQALSGQPVSRDQLQPGDLLFFAYQSGSRKGVIHHVAMYYGDGQMIHSPKTERAVEIIPLHTPEYAIEYAGARRYSTP
ncbi:C40 family peptidase [Paenibacillus sp. y28]|uniref:C40 family peptidase n=1 Tax=Paenibacillus sp. y28 TaxID=3129110 RepID=UPI00301A9EC9